MLKVNTRHIMRRILFRLMNTGELLRISVHVFEASPR